MDNTVTALRMALGLSRREFCQAAQIRLDVLYQIENGIVNVPHRRVLDFLERVGKPRTSLLAAWRDYRAEIRQGVLDKIGSRPSGHLGVPRNQERSEVS